MIDEERDIELGPELHMPTDEELLSAYREGFMARMAERGIDRDLADGWFSSSDPDYSTTPEQAADDAIDYWDDGE